MSIKRSYTNEQFIEAVKLNRNMRDVLVHLSLYPGAGNYQTIRRLIEKLQLNTSHWGKTTGRSKIDDSLLFSQNSKNYSKSKLKKKIVECGLLEYKYQRCNISEWEGETLSLHLDHINGNRYDDRLINLRFLCPNCHSLTETYCVRNIKNKKKIFYCMDCGIEISTNCKRCRKCDAKYQLNGKLTKITWPPLEELIQMVKETSYCGVAKTLGVTDNAIRKHIKRRTK